MSGLRAWLRTGAGHWHGVPALLLAAVLVFRLVGQPLAFASGEPGKVAICMGGQIVYVSLDSLSGDPPDGPASDPCPWFGTAPGIDNPAPLAIALPAPAPVLRVAAPAAIPAHPAPRAGYSPRGPPAVV